MIFSFYNPRNPRTIGVRANAPTMGPTFRKTTKRKGFCHAWKPD